MAWNEEEYNNFVEKLHKNFPDMFTQQYGGVAVSSGWWSIIETLCSQIDSHIKWKNKMAEKYPDDNSKCPQVVVTQIKEKFGGLRFYYDGGDDYIRGLVSMAELWAERTCEQCGAPGTVRYGGWMKTLCDTHEAERVQLQKELK